MKTPEIMEPEKPSLPIAPDLIKQALPPALPQMDFDRGPILSVVPDCLLNWKLKRAERYYERQAAVAKYQNDMVKNTIETIKLIVGFSSVLADQNDEFQHKKAMRAKDAQEKGYRNNLLAFECANAELDYKMKLKAWREDEGISET